MLPYAIASDTMSTVFVLELETIGSNQSEREKQTEIDWEWEPLQEWTMHGGEKQQRNPIRFYSFSFLFLLWAFKESNSTNEFAFDSHRLVWVNMSQAWTEFKEK